MWSSESDGDANLSQLVDEQTVRFQGQTGEKIVHICRFQTSRCFVHCPNSTECLPGTNEYNEAAPRDGTLSSKPRTYVQLFLWCCNYFVPGKLAIMQRFIRFTWCYMSAWPSFRTKGMKKKKKKALCNFRSTESHWISWTSFLLFFRVTIFVSSKMELAQPSHPQLSTSPQVKLGEPTEPASILNSSTLSTMDSVPAVPSVLDHPDFDGSSAKASVYDYEKLQAVQIVSPVLRFTSKPKHVYLKGYSLGILCRSIIASNPHPAMS